MHAYAPDIHIRRLLRVLLDNTPDIWTPIVWGQFLFGCIIKSTYPGGLPKLKSLDLGACTVLWDANELLVLKFSGVSIWSKNNETGHFLVKWLSHNGKSK